MQVQQQLLRRRLVDALGVGAASSSASSWIRSRSASPGSSRCSRARRWRSESKWSGESSASRSRSSGCAEAPASASRSSRLARLEEFRREGRLGPRPPLRGTRPACVSRGRSRRSATRRSACCRSGESSNRPSDLARVNKGLLAIGRPVELEPHAVEDVALRLWRAAARSRRLRRLGRVPAGRATMRTSNPCPAARSIPRSVAASPAASASKQRYELARQPAELLELPLGERGSHRGDHRPEPGLPEREHVRVALDDQRPFSRARSRCARGRSP